MASARFLRALRTNARPPRGPSNRRNSRTSLPSFCTIFVQRKSQKQGVESLPVDVPIQPPAYLWTGEPIQSGLSDVSTSRRSDRSSTAVAERRSRPGQDVQTSFSPPATLFHAWLANASANTSLPISTGAKRSRVPFAFRRIPLCRSRGPINIAGSKLVRDTVK